jgi:ABC-type antimicrobial peptide transport system permease subunit
MLTRENLLLSLVGIPVGLIVGYRAAALMMSSYTSDLFSFDLQMRTSTLVLSGLAVLAVVLAAQWPASRAASRIEIARVVRERAQ